MEKSIFPKAVWLVAGCVLSLAGSACSSSAGSDGDSPNAAQNGGAGSKAGAGPTGSGGTGAGSGGAKSEAGNGGANAGSGGAPGAMLDPTMMAAAGSGANNGTSGTPGMMMMQVDPGDFDYADQAVMLTETLTIDAGKTVRVGPGTTFTASPGVKVQINGTLIVSGSAESPVKFLGAGMPRSWDGIVVASGGVLQLTHAEIGGATYGILAEAGSMYTVDYADIGTSFKVAVVSSDGSFDHTKFHASGDDTFSPVNEVSIDDVNGSLTILDASPTVSNSSFDHSSSLVDMVRIGGKSSPVFDHVSITSAHCGFHANGGVNNAPTIKNSVLDGMSYGIMAYTSKAKFEHCNFTNNTSDIGFCFDATADNAPTLTDNFYSSGSPSFDASCFDIGAPDSMPSATAHDDVGPVGL
jgi:hypothetical protein